jgi:hypothetical protein
MKEQLHCQDLKTREIYRGIPDDADEVLPHKPVEDQAVRGEFV